MCRIAENHGHGILSLSIQVRKEVKETRESLVLVKEERKDLLDQ